MADTCLICELESADASTQVFADDLWAASIVPGYDVPGWYFLRARRHAEKITGLNDDELATFGRRAQDLVAAVTTATGAEATYMLMFGEAFPHFHVLITARGAEIPPQSRGGELLKLRAEKADFEASKALIPAVRAAYLQRAATSGTPLATEATR
ncbi:hypothetical protein [Subtercola lobariae]|uniref:Diadenosine tetraphosphate hydrolase n=1 Tax=Subtercola lobariae TaxID=1588641 RepID=A0A917EYA0_9MICO|nr:hypothetical protein [Subtercola lobariae]GGF31703.1 hypothetical protein GCM10011399_26100 [Subtercola lobariae]